MASISSLGSGSNLDLSSLLDKLVAAEKQAPQDLITSKTKLANATVSAVGTLKSKLSALQDSISKLKDASFYTNKAGTSSDTSVFKVDADTDADAGSYTIGVVNLAQANKIASGNFTDSTTSVGTGTLTIGVGGATFDIAVTAGVNDTVAGIRDAINNASNNTGVKASLLTIDNNGTPATKLVLTATKTGATSQISVSTVDDDTNNTDNAGLSQLYYSVGDASNSHFSEVNKALDAKITVDGFAATSSTNVFDSVINGVTITAVKGATNPADSSTIPTATLSVAADKSAIQSAVDGFVKAYNDVAATFTALTVYDPDTQTGGALSADTSILAISNKLKQIIGEPVSGLPTDLNSLAFLGISTNKDGTLSVDDTKLGNVVNSRFDDVKNLLSGLQGTAGKLDSYISNVVGGGGVLQTRTDTLNDQLRSLGDQQTALDQHIADFTKRYTAQFTALDTLVSQLNSTGDFLTQQLDAAAKIISRKSNS
jgi:flagellar hook-associated protein 2